MNTALYAGLWLLIAQGDGAVTPPALHEMPSEGAESPSGVPGRGPYQGVVPEPEARNPLPHPRSDPPRLIWTGFKMAGERSEIFLQTTRPVEHELAPATGKAADKRAGSLSVLLRNCRIHLRNNARKIDTRYFATPVQGVSARQRRRDVELTISLKDAVVPDIRVQTGLDGTNFLVLSFPAGRPVGDAAGTPAEGAVPALTPPSLNAP